MNSSATPQIAPEKELLPLKEIQTGAIGAALLMLAGAAFWWPGYAVIAGIVSGAVVGIFNFRFIRRLISKIMGEGAEGGGKWAFLFMGKMIGLMAVAGLLILQAKVNPVAFVAGFSSIIIGIFYQAFK